MEAGRVKTRPQVSVLAVLLLLLPEVSVGLELSPSVTEVILNANSSFSVVCSGWGRVTWKTPQEPALEGVRLEDHGTSSVLVLNNVTARHSGNYVCEEQSSEESKDLAIFIPDPEQWFLPLGPGVVMKEGEDGIIPCVVSDPRINVTLYERPGLSPVEGQYQASRGFSAKLKDSSYICRGTLEGEERESTVYYVYSIIVPKSMNAFMTVSQTVVKQGDPLIVNCTVKEAEMVFFSWKYPRKETIEPLTEFLSSRELRIRSFLNISSARLEDSGLYVCTVQESVQGQTAMDNLTVTVLARGYVDLDPEVLTNVSVLQYETVELMVQVEAFPTPNVTWTRGNSTLASDTISADTRQVHETSYLSVLTLVRVRMEQKGLYTVQVTNTDDVKEVTFNLQVTVPPRILDLSDQHVEVGHAVQCITEGVPTPTIHWYSCSSTQRCSNETTAWRVLTSDLVGVVVQENMTTQEERGMEQVRQVRSVLTLESVAGVIAVRCEARNNRGRRARDIRLVSNSLFSQVAVLAAVLALVVIAVIFLIILIALWRKKPRYDIRWKVIESVSSDGQEYTYMDPMHLPYDSVWELPRDSLVLGHPLGSGAFGRVVEATAYSLGHAQTTTKVAVKMLKSTARRSESQALISELKIMSHLGPHLNIVNLLGACTKRGPIYLVTEYCHHGDLVDYLHHSKHTFLQNQAECSRKEAHVGGSSTENMENTSPAPGRSESDGGYMDMTNEESLEYVAMQVQTDVIEYADIEPCVYEMPHQHDTGYQEQDSGQAEAVLSINESPVLSFTDLLGFSFQVAQGMDFLASKNCIHRDLAARNVLVCEGKLVKICDFGLARDITNDSNYVAKGNTFLPLKWMAPESIFQNQYTTLSDVWSFGILLWEIFSLGGTPYPDIPMNEQFYAALKRGYRMPKPTHATEDIYRVMCKCWDEKFEKRPEFSSLVQTTGGLLPDAYRKKYDQACQSFMRCEHPAVVRRTGPRTVDTQDADPSELEAVPRVELKEADPCHRAYIIPIPDIIIETSGEVLDTPTDPTESPHGLNSHADGAAFETPVPLALEGKSTQYKEEPNPSACSPEVEESFL